MKIKWEDADVQVGRRVARNNDAEVFMMGYSEEVGPHGKYRLISLSDGMVIGPYEKSGLTSFLNEGGYMPLEILRDDWRKHIGSGPHV